jgi:hypothetical protein
MLQVVIQFLMYVAISLKEEEERHYFLKEIINTIIVCGVIEMDISGIDKPYVVEIT